MSFNQHLASGASVLKMISRTQRAMKFMDFSPLPALCDYKVQSAILETVHAHY